MDAFWAFAGRMKRYWRLVLAAMMMAAISAGGLGVGLVGMGPVLDNVLGEQRELGDLARDVNGVLAEYGIGSETEGAISEETIAQLPKGSFNAVLVIVIGLGVLTIVGGAANFFHQYFALTVVTRTVAGLRREVFRKVVHLPMRTVLALGARGDEGGNGGGGGSDLVSRVVYDTNAVGIGFNALMSKGVAQVTKGLAGLAAAFWFEWRLALIGMIVAPVLGAVIKKLGKKIRRASRKALEGLAGLYGRTAEAVGGMRVVKVHGAEREESGRFHRINKEVVRQEFKVRTARALASPLVEALTLIVLGGLSLIATKAILDGVIDRGDFIMVLVSLGAAGASIKPLTGIMNDLHQASASAQRVGEVLALEDEPGHGRKLPKLSRHKESIELRGVRFTYPGALEETLKGIDLVVRHGETVAIVGLNGSGKSTLLSFVPRLFDPDEGQVLIDGTDVREVSVRSVRKQVGVVTQDVVLFEGTVGDNIAYGASDVTDEKIVEAAKRARAHEFIMERGGYDSWISQGGGGVSGGQRQRIAIARAILRDPTILILDEATSMIDADSEKQIAEALDEFACGRTGLIVAHRLSTVLHADRIVVMDGGAIVDEGTHGELLERCRVYQMIAKNQLVGGGEALGVGERH